MLVVPGVGHVCQLGRERGRKGGGGGKKRGKRERERDRERGNPHVKLQTHTRKSLEFLGESVDAELALVCLQGLNGLSNVINCRLMREGSVRLVAMDKVMECTCPSHVLRKSSHTQSKQINVVQEGL
jgi:hypothetical protein